MKSLNEIVDEIVKECGHIDLEQALEGYNVPEDNKQYMLETPYFRCLSAYCKLYDVQHALELGTCTGTSAIAMAQNAKQVDTFDVTDEDIDQSLGHKNINFYPLLSPSHCLNINLDPYDLIFIDIDHKGDMELQLHYKLTKEYQGIAFYDDIYFSPEMTDFWNTIEQEKLGVLWHFTGFGIVSY